MPEASVSRRRQTVFVDVWGLQYGWDGLRMELGVRRQSAHEAVASWGSADYAALRWTLCPPLSAQITRDMGRSSCPCGWL